ncbi:MAG TPA: 3-carboxy-cis,cis-muconate cycloisomerase [Afifellaceae bacterium]|nr:3-carboxy-cis,cis-muconate cycloisomerase [Afifellaceae bacterium]
MSSRDRAGSDLLAPIFASGAMRAAFSDGALLQAMLDFEAALARAEGKTGVIPDSAVRPIADACRADLYDIAEIGRAASLAGNPAIPLVKALTAAVREDARAWVHWGGTSQDVIDNALTLLMRQGLRLLHADVRGTMTALVAVTEAHRATPMAGRTWLQQALPVTFSFKVAGWLAALTSASTSLRRVLAEELALQFGGAAGTLAALGGDGTKVRQALAEELELPEPAIAWHADRTRFARVACALGTLSGTHSKIATDVLLMMQTEVAEAFEPAAAGKGGSSTMPHKRNPVGAAAIRANHRRIAGLVTTMLIAMEGEHERGAGSWSAEWETLRDLFCLAGGSAAQLRTIAEGLEVVPERMRANLDATLGLPLAESLMMALAPKIGRMQAHHRVEAASKRAVAEGRHLAEVAQGEPAIQGYLSETEIKAAFDPLSYLGSADAMIDSVLAEARAELEREE